ncbi:MAG: hypothetical protein IPL63_14460 [Saprospiraceae bacterium]|nr:hypothetical protein [Saprospiraceae bacterium]
MVICCVLEYTRWSAVKMALHAGYNIVIITKGLSEGVRKRFENLGVAHIYDKVDKKASAFEHFVRLKNISKKEVLYLGDDIPDLENLPLKRESQLARPTVI